MLGGFLRSGSGSGGGGRGGAALFRRGRLQQMRPHEVASSVAIVGWRGCEFGERSRREARVRLGASKLKEAQSKASSSAEPAEPERGAPRARRPQVSGQARAAPRLRCAAARAWPETSWAYAQDPRRRRGWSLLAGTGRNLPRRSDVTCPKLRSPLRTLCCSGLCSALPVVSPQ
jgi:hypothetical protein